VTRPRVLLLAPTHTYKAEDFLDAAGRLGIDVVVGTDRHQALEASAPGGTITLDFRRPERAAAILAEYHAALPLAGVVASDDESVVLAALAAGRMGLPANPPEAARASRDKAATRERLRAAGMRSPTFATFPVDADPVAIAERTAYPCVLKPTFLNASRGVLRADGPAEFVAAFDRIRALLARPSIARSAPENPAILVEDYLPGAEVSVEGLLVDGRLHVLAIFDKPDTPEGPTFEETLFVTPSTLAEPVQEEVARETRRACAALGLREGPIHAELRVRDGVPWVLEVAARTIGGLCARALRFGVGISLEEVVLRHAAGMPVEDVVRESAASGVTMLPTPGTGRLRAVDGIDDALAVRGVVDVRITVERDADVEPPPEGNRYLGFVFARGETPADVAAALRTAAARLTPRLD